MILKHLKIGLILSFIIAGFLMSCARNISDKDHTEGGMFSEKIYIRTLPTKAKIYVNDKEIGTSPLTIKVRHEERKMINIKALPLYPNQYTQNIFLMVPPVPKTMTIYMNHYPEDYDRSKDTPFSPPEKPLPEVIIQTQIDTVYVEKHSKELISIALPIIYYDTDSFVINPKEETKLYPLIDYLKQEQGFIVDVYGFADFRASNEHNMKLSLNRANAVKEFMVRNGISPSRIYPYGHGKISKVDSTGLELDLSENRKAIVILKKID